MRAFKLYLLLALVALVLAYLASCGRPPEPKPEEPEEKPSEPVATIFEPQPEPTPEQQQPQRRIPQRPPGVYELVWVEPRIVTADTLITVIAADRIDSVEVALSERGTYQTPSISFHVTSANCPARVNLVDGKGAPLMNLFDKELTPGYYKLTLSAHSRNRTINPGSYYLKAEYCGRTKRVAVKLD